MSLRVGDGTATKSGDKHGHVGECSAAVVGGNGPFYGRLRAERQREGGDEDHSLPGTRQNAVERICEHEMMTIVKVGLRRRSCKAGVWNRCDSTRPHVPHLEPNGWLDRPITRGVEASAIGLQVQRLWDAPR